MKARARPKGELSGVECNSLRSQHRASPGRKPKTPVEGKNMHALSSALQRNTGEKRRRLRRGKEARAFCNSECMRHGQCARCSPSVHLQLYPTSSCVTQSVCPSAAGAPSRAIRSQLHAKAAPSQTCTCVSLLLKACKERRLRHLTAHIHTQTERGGEERGEGGMPFRSTHHHQTQEQPHVCVAHVSPQ